MGKKRLLLIDDEINLCKLMKLNLERTGEFEVTVAHSGMEGIEKAKAERFDLVITDFRMPGLDGKVVLDAVKAMTPHTPVVLFSIYHDDAGTITPELERKADGLINKPIDHEQLHKVIKDALARGGGGT